MENPYNEQLYQPVPPQEPTPPVPSLYQGNNNFATASLVMGILSLVFLCCAPPLLFVVSSLGIIFSCLSKGQRARSGAAKAGLAISVSTLVIMSAFLIIICSAFLISPEGSSFLTDYFHIISDDDLTDDELYDFLDKYLYEFNGDAGNDSWNSDDSLDYYEDSDEFNLPPEFFQQPEIDNSGNVI